MLSWSPSVKAPSGASYQVNGYINSDNLVERVETWLGENLMGDMHIVASYSDYRAFGGAVVPTKIEQTRGGWPFFEVERHERDRQPAEPRGAGAAAGRRRPAALRAAVARPAANRRR